jgi:Uma2 family endonuclease
MATVLEPRSERIRDLTLVDLTKRFGPIPSSRIRTSPPPGILVEKTVGYEESMLAVAIGEFLRQFARSRRLGLVAGEAGMMKLAPGLVQIPDVSYVSFANLPGGKRPRAPIPNIVPDLAVEVLSPSNTPQELRLKLARYFEHGVRLVWLVDARRRTVEVYTSRTKRTVVKESQTLTGGNVLPGLKIKLRELFAELDES